MSGDVAAAVTDHADTIRLSLVHEESGLLRMHALAALDALLVDREQAIDALRRVQLVPISPEGAKRAVELSERGLRSVGERP